MDPQQFSNPTGSNVPNYSTNPTPTGHKKIGPTIAVLVIVLVLVIAALYFFASGINDTVLPGGEPLTGEPSLAPDGSGVITNTADDLDSLQKDLDASIPEVE